MSTKDPFIVVQSAIEKRITRHGGLRAAARVLEISAPYLCRLRYGEKVAPDDVLLRKLGLERVISYRPLR